MKNKITRAEWVREVLEALECLSDVELQARAWTGLGPEVSSPGEMIDDLFDEVRFREFIAGSPSVCREEGRSIIENFERAVDTVVRGGGTIDDPLAALDSPEWNELRVAARSVHSLIARDE